MRLLRDEQGMALVMALGIMMVLTLALGTVIYMTAAGARDAQRTNAGQKATALAEAGINNVLAQIATHYPNAATRGTNAWVASPPSPVAYEGGTVTWSGQFEGTLPDGSTCPSSTWCLKGTGTVKNPTGPGTNDVVRTVTARAVVSLQPAFFTPYGIFSDDPNAQCTDVGGNVTINVPIYVKNCLMLRGTLGGAEAKVWDPCPTTGCPIVGGVSTSTHSVTVNVVHALTLSGANATIGVQNASTDHRVKLVAHGSCVSCGTAIHTLSETMTPDNSVSLPPLDAAAYYSSVPWGSATCTTTGGASNPYDTSPPRNNLGGNLFPSSGTYSCSVTDVDGQVHSIAYNASTHALTVNNSWFVDGNVIVPNVRIDYTGKGTIYVNGTVTFNNGSASLCASTDCASWDPTNDANPNLLIVSLNATATPVATSFLLAAQAKVEANAWAIGNGTGDTSPPPTATCATGAFMSSGSAQIGGSVWTQNGCASITGGGVLHSAVALPAGSPTSFQYVLSRPTNYGGG